MYYDNETVTLKGILWTDFVNYKKVCTTLEFPICDFKCCKECGKGICQNLPIVDYPDITVQVSYMIKNYLNDDITEAICFQGLEPLDSYDDCLKIIKALRNSENPKKDDDIVIYTGYTEDEVREKGIYDELKHYHNIVLKVGRFVPNQEQHYDEILGIKLFGENQYGIRL